MYRKRPPHAKRETSRRRTPHCISAGVIHSHQAAGAGCDGPRRDDRIFHVSSIAHSEPRRADGRLPGILLLLAIAPYLNSLRNGFVYDDLSQILANPYVHSFRYLKEIFSSTVWSFQGAQGILPYYRPVMTLGYAICWHFFGPIALGYHLMSILLQVGVVWLVFFTGRRLLRNDLAAFFAGALFALHPIHTESVAWVAGVTDLELTFFYLLTFLFFFKLGEAREPRWWTIQSLMAGSFILALLSKEHGITLLVLAVLYENVVRDDRHETSLRTKISRYGVLWVVAGAYLVFRASVLGGVIPQSARPGLSRYEAVLTALQLLGKYCAKLLWPAHLTLFYHFEKSSHFSDPRVLAGLAALFACFVVLGIFWKRNRPAVFALLWFLLTLSPILNARWMLSNVFAERYLYLPSVGFCWLAGMGLAWLRRAALVRTAALRWAFASALCVVAVLCSVRIVLQNPIWRDQETFITRTLAASPGGEAARANLAAIYWNKGDLASAEREWLKALSEDPQNVIALVDLGRLRVKQGRYEEAATLFQKAQAIRPSYSRSWLGLGDLYVQEGRTQEAEAEYRAAVKLAPLNPFVRNHFAGFLFNSGRFVEAEVEFRASLAIDPTPEAYARLGDVALRRQDGKGAMEFFSKAVELEPFDSYSHFRLAERYAVVGQVRQAIREYEAGLQTDPKNPDALAAVNKLRVIADRR